MNTQRRIASFSKLPGRPLLRMSRSASCMLFLVLAAAATPACAQNTPQSASDRYKAERADCYNGRSNEDRATCLKEAKAAFAEDRKGNLTVPGATYQKNAALRCQSLPATDKVDCEKRMRGEGTVSGSAESGGEMRELVVPSPSAGK